MPWLCVGDFNEILSFKEKIGGAIRPARQIEIFRRTLQDCNSQELVYDGLKFTWSRGKRLKMIMERLDCGLANDALLEIFSFLIERHLVSLMTDHTPLLFFSNQPLC